MSKKKQRRDAALLSSESNEWYTPLEFIEAARAVMGGIDLDPASCPEANRRVRASTYYTIQDDGLGAAVPWFGRVWLNPPYGRGPGNVSNQEAWSRQLISDYDAGYVEQGILLVNSSPDTAWFQTLFRFPICFVASRIRFHPPATLAATKQDRPQHGNAFVYLGPNLSSFADTFTRFGSVVITCDNLAITNLSNPVHSLTIPSPFPHHSLEWCEFGHLLDDENTLVVGKYRRCRTCNRLRSQRFRESLKTHSRLPKPTRRELAELMQARGATWTSIARTYGVSDIAVRKWAKSYQLI